MIPCDKIEQISNLTIKNDFMARDISEIKTKITSIENKIDDFYGKLDTYIEKLESKYVTRREFKVWLWVLATLWALASFIAYFTK